MSPENTHKHKIDSHVYGGAIVQYMVSACFFKLFRVSNNHKKELKKQKYNA